MNRTQTLSSRKRLLPFKGLSIQQRLPLLICILLLSIIIAVGLASYIGVKRTSLTIAGERLHTLTVQLSSMFGQSSKVMTTATRAAASQEAVKNYLQSGGRISDSAARSELQKIASDTQTVAVELVMLNGKILLPVVKRGIQLTINRNTVLAQLAVAPDSCRVGKIYRIRDSLYYPVIATVTDHQQTIGYIIRWRLIFATAKTLEQFSQLLGTDAALYIGNADETIWTNLMKVVDAPPVNVKDTGTYFNYTRPDAEPVIAMARPIANTPWILLLEFPRKKILEEANRFASWILIMGALITAIGIVAAWVMSRNITEPLKKLTAASKNIAEGDYNVSVNIEQEDELGELAMAFNSMAVQINQSQHQLEEKVSERTAQLETVNKELEAFSYSVSHDLRAPLRAISGYAVILKEEYGNKLDAEALRIANTIITNAKMMGQLIDDLIDFSKIGTKGIASEAINMNQLAASCAEALLKNEPVNKYHLQINELQSCQGDYNLLRQVWMNLIGNAIKYSSLAEMPFIEIGCKKEDNACTYFIRDNGVGFDMQYADQLFGVFQRLHTDEVFKGTGIGLALVKRIITKHNGEVWGEAEKGKGATFYFRLSN